MPCGIDVVHVHDNDDGLRVVAIDVGAGYHQAVLAPDRVEVGVAEDGVPLVDAGDPLFHEHDSGHDDLPRIAGMSTIVDID